MELLQQAGKQKSIYLTEETERRRLLLLAQVSREPVEIAADDLPLLLRAKAAYGKKDFILCRKLLEVCQEKENRTWRYWMGDTAFALGEFAQAVQYYPEDCYGALEACYRNLGDYKMAYEYACKLRENSSISQKESV
jgi:hypothetical protein